MWVAESECDSDFADDEMSPAIRLSRDENDIVPTVSEIRTLRTLRKPVSVGDHSDLSEAAVASAGESSLRSDQSKQEVVQKDVIMVQTETSKSLCKQEYLDELLQQIRFQIRRRRVRSVRIRGLLICLKAISMSFSNRSHISNQSFALLAMHICFSFQVMNRLPMAMRVCRH